MNNQKLSQQPNQERLQQLLEDCIEFISEECSDDLGELLKNIGFTSQELDYFNIDSENELPTNLIISIDDLGLEDEDVATLSKDDLRNSISDYLSNCYCYCTFGFAFDLDADTGSITVTDIDWDYDD